ncbi:MAG: bifunctional glutamate--cysteine ligase GshA/glutathione synthetase GshB [Fusobacteriota bacterium]
MNFTTKGYEDLELSTQILIKEAINRKIKIDLLDRKENFIRISKGNKTEYIKQATKTSLDSYIVPLIMENKNITKKILKENNINVAKGKCYYDLEKAFLDYNKFKNSKTVIKPNNTNFGKGISILDEGFSKKEYQKSIKESFIYDDNVLIENFIPGQEYRFLIIGDKVSAVLKRIPANVSGDGVKSIEELVRDKNLNPLRGIDYRSPLIKIKLGDFEKNYLQLHGKDINYIPKKGEIIYLRENSNVSTGGDSIDFTDEMPIFFKETALKAVQSVDAKICGLDMIIGDLNKTDYGVVELNFNPAIHIHRYPAFGKQRKIENDILDLLGF